MYRKDKVAECMAVAEPIRVNIALGVLTCNHITGTCMSRQTYTDATTTMMSRGDHLGIELCSVVFIDGIRFCIHASNVCVCKAERRISGERHLPFALIIKPNSLYHSMAYHVKTCAHI